MVKRQRIKISVTEDDIKRGDPSNGRGCPIARALRRMDYRGYHVGINIIEWHDWSGTALPAEAAKFISDFDAKKEVKPFSFWIVR